MEKIPLKGKTYDIVVNYKDDEKLRNSFNGLTRKTYGFDFEDWYQKGYWKDRYVPYSIVSGDAIVSNISVNIIDFLLCGVKRTTIQIGTVMTDMEYRDRGLNRALMERVLRDWRGKCDLIYLFANDSVLGFYPKFGFSSAKEYQHSKIVKSDQAESDCIRLNMSDETNTDFLFNRVNHSRHFSKFSMKDNASLVMFYCTYFMNQQVYFIKKLDAIVIAEFTGSVLYINDIFSETEVSIDDIILSMINRKIKRVVLGFTPEDRSTFDEKLLQQADTTLFVLDDKWGLFENKKIMFPVLSHA